MCRPTETLASVTRLRAHAAGVQCPVERAIHVIGGRWKMLVLRSLMLDGPQRYNRLLEAIPGISAKELTRNLRELESLGLVSRDEGGPKQTTYALSAVGAELGPAFEKLIPFGEKLAQAWEKEGARPLAKRTRPEAKRRRA